MVARGGRILIFAAALFLINQNIKKIIIKGHVSGELIQTTTICSPFPILNHSLTQLGIGSGKDERHKPLFGMPDLYRQNC